MKKFFSDFKAFITKGNIVDLAVAVVVGGAFGKIVTSLVNDIIMPLITLIVGGVSVAEWKWIITPEVKDAAGTIIQAESALHYGNFLQTIIDFLIIAFFIFLTLRILMNAQKGLGMLGDEIGGTDKKAKRAYRKQLKAQGLTKEQIVAAEEEKAAADAAAAKAQKEQEEAEKAAEEAAAKAESTEGLLAQIRDLLAAQNGDSGKNAKSDK